MSLLDSYRASFEARRESAQSDAEFLAADPDTQQRARDEFRLIIGNAALDFDALASTRQPRPVSRDWTTVFTPVRLNYPPGRADGLEWLAELSVQRHTRLPHQDQARTVRRISIFEPDLPVSQGTFVNPRSVPTLRGIYPEVTLTDKPVILDSARVEPFAPNVRQLAEFYSLLIDVRNAAVVEEAA